MKVVFLDRDGTIIQEKKDYITSIKQVKVFSSAPKALKRLQQAGYKLIIVTNQSCIARGLITEQELKKINQYIRNLYLKKGVRLGKFYYCPHHSEGIIAKYRKVCSCRKPATGMFQAAKREMRIDFKKSFMIGDTLRDVKAGKKVGAKTILVLTGYGRETMSSLKRNQQCLVDYIAPNLFAATKWILNNK